MIYKILIALLLLLIGGEAVVIQRQLARQKPQSVTIIEKVQPPSARAQHRELLSNRTVNKPEILSAETDEPSGTKETIVVRPEVKAGEGISLSDGFTINNTDRGSLQSIFKIIGVDDESVVAKQNEDKLSFVSGQGIDLVLDKINKKITINSTSVPEAIDLSFSALTAGTNTDNTFVLGNGSSLGTTGTGSINATSLQGASWAAPPAIGNLTPNTGSFTTLTGTMINGLSIANNGSNTLNIAAGKTLAVNNTLTLSGTDGTSFVFPTASGTLVSEAGVQTLTNKTFSSPTILGASTFSSLGTGIAHFNSAGLLSSSAINLASGDVSGILPLTLGGTGATSAANARTNLGLVSGGGGDIWVNRSGDTMTGDLTLNKTLAAVRTGTNQNLNLIPSGTGYTLIGDAGITTHSLNTNDDLLVTGRLEVDGVSYFDGETRFGNNVTMTGQYFTQGITPNQDNAVTIGGSTKRFAEIYVDTNRTNKVQPILYGTSLVLTSLGTSFVRVGTSGNTSHILSTGEDFMVSNRLEVNGMGYFDAGLNVQDVQTATVAAQIYNASTSADADGLTIKLGNNSSASVSSTNHFLSFETAGIGIVGSIQGNNGKGIQLAQNGIADYAEYMKKDASDVIPEGSLLCMQKSGFVTSCDENNTSLIGVSSAHPFIIAGDNLGDGSVAVGLTGLIDTRVSSENGAILPGDRITSSSLSGVGVKAVKAGMIVGTALEGYDGERPGTIRVSIHLSWYDPTSPLITAALPPSDKPFAKGYDVLGDLEEATLSGTLSVAGRTVLSDLGVTGKIQAGLLTINGMGENCHSEQSEESHLDASPFAQHDRCSSIDTIAAPLFIQSHGLNGVDFLKGKVVIQPTGDMIVKESITAGKYNVATDDPQASSFGKAFIPIGKKLVIVETTAIAGSSGVFTTPETPIETPLFISSKKVGSSFTVEMLKPAKEAVHFNWWVVN